MRLYRPKTYLKRILSVKISIISSGLTCVCVLLRYGFERKSESRIFAKSALGHLFTVFLPWNCHSQLSRSTFRFFFFIYTQPMLPNLTKCTWKAYLPVTFPPLNCSSLNDIFSLFGLTYSPLTRTYFKKNVGSNNS